MSSSSGAGASVGAEAPGRRRRPWWVWLVLAAVLLLLLALGLSRCGTGTGDAPGGAGDAGTAQDGSRDGAGQIAGAPAPGAGGAAGAAGGAAGTLTADGAPVLPLSGVAAADGSLAGLVGRSVTGSGVTVQSVPADEGFWLGSSETDRVWVALTGTGESGYVVQQGDRVDLTGTVVAHDAGFAAQVGVDPAEGAQQLTTQAAHVEVAKTALRTSS
jgi:hypothetical protein